jgi:hypothetical protein
MLDAGSAFGAWILAFHGVTGRCPARDCRENMSSGIPVVGHALRPECGEAIIILRPTGHPVPPSLCATTPARPLLTIMKC